MGDKPDVLNQVLAQRQRVNQRLTHINHVVAVMSGKGGVGKSALTANIAAALGMGGWTVGVVDADIHGPSAAAMLGARKQRVLMDSQGARPAIGVADVRVMSMDLLLGDDDTAVTWEHPGGLAADSYVWRGTLEANVLREFLGDTDWGSLDILLVDMPPGADRFETLMRFIPDLSGVLVVTIPSQVSHLVVRRAIQSAKHAGARLLGLAENMAGLVGPDGEIARELFQYSSGETLAIEMNIPCMGKIPFDPRLARTTDSGRPFVLNYADTPTGQAIQNLVQNLEEVLR